MSTQKSLSLRENVKHFRGSPFYLTTTTVDRFTFVRDDGQKQTAVDRFTFVRDDGQKQTAMEHFTALVMTIKVNTIIEKFVIFYKKRYTL